MKWCRDFSLLFESRWALGSWLDKQALVYWSAPRSYQAFFTPNILQTVDASENERSPEIDQRLIQLIHQVQ
jgi:hypothetical protein